MAERTPWTAAAEALRPWRSAAGAAALVLIGGQLLWRAALLGRGYFTQDDFLMLTLGARPLSLDLLLQDYSGHLFPGGFLFAWANSHLAPLDWTLAVVEIVVLQLIASALAWLVLCRLLPGSWWRLAVLSVYLFCPLALWPTQWWAVAIQYLPVCIFLFLATWALLHRLQENSRWSGPRGRARDRRGTPVPGTRGAVPRGARVRGRGVRRGGRPAQDRRGPPEPPRRLGAPGRADRRLRDGAPRARTDRQRLAGLGGGVGRAGRQLPGPQRRPRASPAGPGRTREGAPSSFRPTWAVVLGWTVLVGVVALTLYRSLSAVWGWLLLLVYTLADAVLLFGGRTGPDFGEAWD